MLQLFEQGVIPVHGTDEVGTQRFPVAFHECVEILCIMYGSFDQSMAAPCFGFKFGTHLNTESISKRKRKITLFVEQRSNETSQILEQFMEQAAVQRLGSSSDLTGGFSCSFKTNGIDCIICKYVCV